MTLTSSIDIAVFVLAHVCLGSLVWFFVLKRSKILSQSVVGELVCPLERITGRHWMSISTQII